MKYPRFLRYADLAHFGIHYSRMHLSRLEAQGAFPKRVQLSPSTIAWYEHEVVAWMEGRGAERFAGAGVVADPAPGADDPDDTVPTPPPAGGGKPRRRRLTPAEIAHAKAA